MGTFTAYLDSETEEIKKKLKAMGYNLSEIFNIALIKKWNEVNPDLNILDRLDNELKENEIKRDDLFKQLTEIDIFLKDLREKRGVEIQKMAEKKEKERENNEKEAKKERDLILSQNKARIDKLKYYINQCKENYQLDQDPQWLEQLKKHEAELSELIGE